EGLGGALLEAAHVDQAGRDDLTPFDGGHPRHRHEDPAAPGHLDDEADDPRAPGGGEGDDDVAYPTDLVAERVEDLEARQARDEEAGGSTHGSSLTTPTEVPRTSRTGPPFAGGDPGGRPGGR